MSPAQVQKNFGHMRAAFGFRRQFWRARGTFQSREFKTILGVLLHMWDTECYNPLDKIYATLPLERPLLTQRPFPVDYTISTTQLYVRVLVERYEESWEHWKNTGPELLATSLELSNQQILDIGPLLQTQIAQLPPERRHAILEFMRPFLQSHGVEL